MKLKKGETFYVKGKKYVGPVEVPDELFKKNDGDAAKAKEPKKVSK